MSKSTSAVIMVSPARLPPWGDDGWRFSGAMQLVTDGPDWLSARWPALDGAESHGSERFTTMTLRDQPSQRAEDIAVMVFALLQVPEWHGLASWWDPATDRDALRGVLEPVASTYAGAFKLAVVHTGARIGVELLDALRDLGFEVTEFRAVAS